MYNNYVRAETANLYPLLHYSFKRIVNTTVRITIRSSMIIKTTFQPQG
jgi:hypothetical protein